MKLDKFQKAKVVLGLSLFGLFLAVLLIPSLINQGNQWASENTLETIFLVLSYFATLNVFWHYDYLVRKKTKETFDLSSKLKNKEKELLETFQYLGKVNVQFSVIRDLLDSMKKPLPKTKENLQEALEELLNIVCNATGREKAWIKIINTQNGKILAEEKGGYAPIEEDKDSINAGKLLDMYKGKIPHRSGDFEVLFSRLDNFYIKAFLILPIKEDQDPRGRDFLKALANQSEILFLLFDSQYYRPKNNKLKK